MKKIKNIKNNDSDLKMVARIERVSLLSSSLGQSYMSLTLADRTGHVEARKWTINEEDKIKLAPNQLILLTKAVASEYRGQLQLKINEYQIVNESDLAQHNLTLDDFYKTAPLDTKAIYKELKTLLKSFKNEVYREIPLTILNRYHEQFITFPAAMSIHHNVKGGLLWHSYSLVKNIQALQQTYNYVAVDWELLVAGAILHDVGKVIELADVNASNYSLEGKLIGHISLGNAAIEQVATELRFIDYAQNERNASVTLLQHLVLASHGKNEFGSPIEPHLIESIILSTLDNLDARLYRVNEEINKTKVDSWTSKISTEGNKMFYHHHHLPERKKNHGE